MSQETETNQEDLLRAKEKGQCESDEQYIQNYYTKQARRRKRHRQNEKEHLWQAEERLAMTQEDFDIGSTLFRKPRYVGAAAGAAAQTNDPFRQAVSKAKQQPAHQLSSSVKSLAARLDNKKRKVQEKWDDMWQPWSYKHGSCNGASSSKNDSMNGPWLDYNAGVDDDQSWGDKWRAQGTEQAEEPHTGATFSAPKSLHSATDGWQVLPKPWFPATEHEAPADFAPLPFVERRYPKSRTFGYNRVPPRLTPKTHPDRWVSVKPPFGIQLIQSYFEWKQSNFKP